MQPQSRKTNHVGGYHSSPYNGCRNEMTHKYMQGFFCREEGWCRQSGIILGKNVNNEGQKLDISFLRETTVHADNQAVIRILLNSAGIDQMIGARD